MYKKVISIVLVLSIVFTGGYFTAKQLVPTVDPASTGPKYATKPVVRGDVKVGVNITGQLNANFGGAITAPKPEGITDVNGGAITVEYTVEEVFVKENAPIKVGEPVVRLSAGNLGDIITDFNDKIADIQGGINDIKSNIDGKIEALGEKVNKDITDISQVNPSDGIVITAPIRGRLSELPVAEGDKVEQSLIATIVDDSKVKIPFKVNSREYEDLKIGDKVLIQFRRVIKDTITDKDVVVNVLDELYPGTIKSLNQNPVPNSDVISYIHQGVIEADNPGLIQKDMIAVIYTQKDDTPITALKYESKVESYVNEKKVYSAEYSDSDKKTVIATEVPVSQNEFVEKGQVLIRIAGNDVSKSIQSDIDDIKKEYDKIKAENEKIDDVQKKIQKIQELSSKMLVTAPNDGMVSWLQYNVGDTIKASNDSDRWSLQLMDMYNTKNMSIYTTVSDLDVNYISQDAPVVVTVDALPGQEFEGTVVRLNQYTDQNGKTVYNVNIDVAGGDGLKPGMNTNCFIDAGESLDTLIIPIEAVFEENKKQKVEVLNENGEVEVVEIEIGLANETQVEVLSGLEEGQLVVTGSTKDLMPSQSVPQNNTLIPGAN